MSLTPRQRVLAAARHQQPDRVPLFYRDVPEVRARLMGDLGCESFEALLRELEIDFRWVEPAYVGPPRADPDRPDRRRDIWGVEYRFVRFSPTAGYWEIDSHPLAGVTEPAELDDYPWPTLAWFDFSAVTEQAAAAGDYAVMTAPGYASPSLLQSPIQGLRGDEQALVDLAVNGELFDALMAKVLAFELPFVEAMLSAGGGRIDFFRVGDDYGTQRSLLIGREMFRRHLAPALRELGRSAKRHGAMYYHHSCGAVRGLIDDLIEVGVDVLDPLQVRAEGMVPAELKAAFGRRVCFSGGVDQQRLLPRGSPGDVREAVFALLDDMAPGGGFFLGPTHNFQDDVPTANIVAMYRAGREWARGISRDAGHSQPIR